MSVTLSNSSFIDRFIKRLKMFSIMTIVISFFAIIYLGAERWNIRTAVINDTKVLAKIEADVARNEIDAQLKFAMQSTQQLADDITDGKLPYEKIEKTIQKKLLNIRENPNKTNKFFAISVAFGKGLYDKKQPEQLMNWYCFYDKKEKKIINKSRDHNYTDKTLTHRNTAWYVSPVESGQAMWDEPRFSSTTHEFIAGYSVPFYTDSTRKKAIGVVYINYSVVEIRNIIHDRSFMKTGYGIVFSKQGELIYHPNELIVKGINSRHQNKVVNSVYNANDLKTINYVKQIQHDALYTLPDGKKAWIISTTIPSTQWQLKVIFLLSELGLDEKTLSSQLYLIAAIVIFLSSVLSYIFTLNREHLRVLWLISMAITLILITATAGLWSLSDSLLPNLAEGAVKLITKSQITAFEEKHNKIAEVLELKPPIYIPTGVFFKSAQFEGANNLTISAYVWQKYHFGSKVLSQLKDQDSICNYESDLIPKTKGVSFIEAIESEIDFNCPQATYAMRDSEGNVTLGWYVKLNIRQSFDYSRYPFDKDVIWLRMNHSDFDKNMVLIPDTQGYSLLYEGANTGINLQGFVLPGWQLSRSYFSMVTAVYNSNWGIENFVGQVTPELYFNVEIKRDFMDPFISNVTPVIMVVLVLLIILFASSDNEDLAGKLGFNAIAVFAILGGLLFPVALWHSGFRTMLASAKLSYFESFYIICYFLIIIVGLDSLVLSSHYQASWLRYRDNLAVKLSFLPLAAALIFFATLMMLF